MFVYFKWRLDYKLTELNEIVSSFFILITFFLNQERRRHPAILIFSRSVCDFSLALIWIATSIKSPLDCDSPQGKLSAFLIEFFVIASETILACLSFDVIIHSGDPFADYRENLKKYFLFVFITAFIFAFSLLKDGESIGESFLPVCWTKYEGGRVISNANVPMSVYFYIPWSVIFLLSVAALGQASVYLGFARKQSARSSALRDARRVILAHATYWGLVLIFFAPLTNSNNERLILEDIVGFLSGARALENALVWFPKLTKKQSNGVKSVGEIDLSPMLNQELKRDVLVSTVVGLSHLLNHPDQEDYEYDFTLPDAQQTEVYQNQLLEEEVPLLNHTDDGYTDVNYSSVRASGDLDINQQTRERRRQEMFYVIISISPMLLAFATSGFVAIVDLDEPSYVSMVFFVGFALVTIVLMLSWYFAFKQLEKTK